MRNPERDEAIKREEAEAAKANQERVEQQIASKATLESALKDQDSAKYGDVVSHQLANGTFAFCGMVNARNGFGGYAGYQRFVATPSAAATEEAGGATFRKTWNRVCTKPGDPVEMW